MSACNVETIVVDPSERKENVLLVATAGRRRLSADIATASRMANKRKRMCHVPSFAYVSLNSVTAVEPPEPSRKL